MFLIHSKLGRKCIFFFFFFSVSPLFMIKRTGVKWCSCFFFSPLVMTKRVSLVTLLVSFRSLPASEFPQFSGSNQ